MSGARDSVAGAEADRLDGNASNGSVREAVDGPLSERVAEILADVAARADEQEDARRLSERTFASLTELGFFRALVPARFGGDELDIEDVLQAVRRLAAADASTAWVAGLLAAHQHIVAYFDPRVQEEVWATGPDTIVTTSGEPVGRAEQVDGGIRLSGRWRFSSGSDYADWVLVGFTQPQPDSAGPAAYLALVPRSDIRVEDTWFTYGMRGSGSKDLEITDAFVPSYRMVPFPGGAEVPRDLHPNGLYRLPFLSVFTAPFAALMLGAAEGALAVQREKLRSRVRNYSGVSGVTSVAQLRLGESSLEVRAAIALVERHWKLMAWHAREGIPVSDEQWGAWRHEDCYAGELVTRALERLLKSGGGSVVYSSGSLQRIWRDVHTMRAHVWFDFDNVAQQHARQLLGLEPDPALGP